MQTVLDTVKQLVDSYAKVTLAVYIDGEKLDVGIGAGSYTGACSGDDEFSFGNACAANFNISLAVSRPNLKGRRIQITWTVDGTEYPLLTGQIDKAPIAGGRTEIEAWDDMYFAGSNTFAITEAVATDCDAAAALSAVAAAMGVAADPDALTILSGLAIPGGLSDLSRDATNATVAGYIAGLVGGNAVMTRDGLLTVKQYLATGWETEPYSGGASAEAEDFSITGITLQREVLAAHTNGYGTSYEVLETREYAAGDGSSVLGNPLASQVAANRAYAALQTVVIRPGNYSIPGGLLLEPGDIFTVHSMDGNYAVAVGMISMDFDGGVKSLVSCGGGVEDVGATGPINQALKAQEYNYSQIKKILSVAVYYYLSASCTELSGGSWSTTAPTWEAGKYIWSKTVTTYSDGSSSESAPACITGAPGRDGVSGKGVSSIVNYYLATASESGVTVDTDGWTTSVQSVSASLRYLWNYEVINYTDGSSEATAPCIIGAYGATGADGKGILEITECYARATSNSEEPMSWSTEVPTLTSTYRYLWNYEIIAYTDGSTAATARRVIGVYGDPGLDGIDGVGVSSIATQFYLSTSKTTQTGGSWVETMPTWSTGLYLWTRSKITYTDGTVSYTSPVCDSSWEAVDELDQMLDYEGVLDRLTDGGRIKGLFTEGDVMCLNADCIRAIEKLFAKDITMTGKFLYTSQAYLPPTYTDAITMLWRLYYPAQYPDFPDVDLNGDGVVDSDDCVLAYKVADGAVSMSDCAGAETSEVTVCIDLSNTDKIVCISGTNMWGTPVEVCIGANANVSTFASRERLDRMFTYDPQTTNSRRILYRDLGYSDTGDIEYLNPPLEEDVVYATYDTIRGKAVKKKLDSATGRLLWSTDGHTWSSYAALMGAVPATYAMVTEYGAKGDGVTDDTAAFQVALAANRVVRVPGGTYVLSGTLVIRENCCLELSQDTVLQFTQTSGNCIEVGCSATLKGNHAVIYVPYAFDGHIIDVDTSDETERSTPPYPHWDPMWKSGRYVYDVCLVKANPSGLHYSTDGTCSGTAIYMEADSKGALSYIWGAMLQGIRIAGAFSYGIQVINYDDSAEDDGWNHDMRIEAVIQGCETSVSLTNCNAAHLALAIQCSSAQDGTKYAKWGVRLDDCKYTDMMTTFIWDWHAASTESAEYTHIAMYGSCPGLVLSDVRAISSASDIRDLIYTDTPSNLDSMVVLQEPITRWFKSVNGEPYFNNGTSEKPLMLREEMQEYFLVDRVQGYTDVLPLSTDADGNIYNGIGYKNNGEYYDTSWSSQTDSIYYFTTGFIPVKAGDILRGEGMSFAKEYDANCRISLFDANKAFIDGCSISATLLVNDGGNYFVTHSGTDDSFEILIKSTDGQWPVNSSVAYARLQFLARCVGDNPTMAINEEICYKNEGFLADGVKVKGDNVYLYSPGGKTFALHVGDDGSLSAAEVSI